MALTADSVKSLKVKAKTAEHRIDELGDSLVIGLMPAMGLLQWLQAYEDRQARADEDGSGPSHDPAGSEAFKDTLDFYIEFIAKTVLDPDSLEPMFDADEWRDVFRQNQWTTPMIRHLFLACQEHNGAGIGAQGDLEKKSDTPDGGSGSD